MMDAQCTQYADMYAESEKSEEALSVSLKAHTARAHSAHVSAHTTR